MRRAIGLRHYRGRAALAGLAAILLAAACDANVILLQPEQAVTGDAITLEVKVTDPALAQRLGWSPGTGVPEATVHIRRDQTRDEQSFVTDEEGVLQLPDLPSSRYWVWVEKRLNGRSRARRPCWRAGASSVSVGAPHRRSSSAASSAVRWSSASSTITPPAAEVLNYNELQLPVLHRAAQRRGHDDLPRRQDRRERVQLPHRSGRVALQRDIDVAERAARVCGPRLSRRFRGMAPTTQ